MLEALNESGNIIHADKVTNPKAEYRCKDCRRIMQFVDANIRAKHFRHLEKCDCESEPETPEHAYHKNAVYTELCKMNIGQVFLEHTIDNTVRPDILLVRENAPAVAIEVQASNMDLSLFEKKIHYYQANDYLTLYLFVQSEVRYRKGRGEYWKKTYTTDFLRCTRKNVYRLKEIEQRLLYNEYYGENVRAAYIFDHTIYIYDFERKFSRGNEGMCTTTFRTDWNNNRKGTIRQYFEQFRPPVVKSLYQGIPSDAVKPSQCSHPQVEYKLRPEHKTVRYQIICSACGKHQGWLPNKKAIQLGLFLPDKQPT